MGGSMSGPRSQVDSWLLAAMSNSTASNALRDMPLVIAGEIDPLGAVAHVGMRWQVVVALHSAANVRGHANPMLLKKELVEHGEDYALRFPYFTCYLSHAPTGRWGPIGHAA
jgi:hypothetical protein